MTWNTETRASRKARQLQERDGLQPVAIIEDEANMTYFHNKLYSLPIQADENLVYTAELSSDPGEPKTWQEAFQGEHAQVWMKSAGSEIMSFIKRNTWKKIPMTKFDKQLGRKPIPTKVVLKTKFEHDGSIRNKTRIVTKGFQMIPGVDYTESFSPDDQR